MSSSERSEPLDLDNGLPVTAEDVLAQRRRREAPSTMSVTEYFRFLAAFPPASYEQLKGRRGPQGEPFTLPPE